MVSSVVCEVISQISTGSWALSLLLLQSEANESEKKVLNLLFILPSSAFGNFSPFFLQFPDPLLCRPEGGLKVPVASFCYLFSTFFRRKMLTFQIFLKIFSVLLSRLIFTRWKNSSDRYGSLDIAFCDDSTSVAFHSAPSTLCHFD